MLVGVLKIVTCEVHMVKMRSAHKWRCYEALKSITCPHVLGNEGEICHHMPACAWQLLG